MRPISSRSLALSAWLAATALPADAIVVDQRAVAQLLVLVFLVYAAILFLVVLGLVALVSGQARRKAQLRVALIAFAVATAAGALVLQVMAGSAKSAAFEQALLSGVIFLAAVALALIVRAFMVSRRR